MGTKFVRVAVRAESYQYDKPYTYILPENLAESVVPGVRVIVPFGRGNRQVQALVLETMDKVDEERKLKSVRYALDEKPLISQTDLKLVLWIRDKYFCTCFDALRLFIPAGLDYKKDTVYCTNAECEESVSSEGAAARIYAFISEQGKEVSLDTIKKAFPDVETQTLLAALIRKKLITEKNKHIREMGDKTAKFASICGDYSGARLGKRQAEALEYLEMAQGEASVKDISYYTGASMQTLRSLERAGVLHIYDKHVLRLVFRREEEPVLKKDPELNPEQRAAFESLYSKTLDEKPSAALLYGVTGSGKTFVYIKLIREVLKQGKTVIVLVPEIALTPQLLERFYAYFGNRVALMHSGLGLGERSDEWKRVKYGQADVVIGTRSAIFAPTENLGLIIIDEEQEYTYKSERSPRYHARDIAKYRAVQHNALLLLGSATPSLESMHAARGGRYSLYTLQERYGGIALPEVSFADMQQELRSGNAGQISTHLAQLLKETIDKGKQSILFLNRRGDSRYVLCHSCGCVPKCPNCSVSMTFHSANNRLMCHYCGHSEHMLKQCPECASVHLGRQGAGTQRVAQELSELFPEIEIIRMDADTTGGKQSHEELLARFRDENIPILLGTQMITKGLDFDNVILVGVLDADQLINIPDFRANERAFSLITQVVGRAGRSDKTGKAVIQTFCPDNPVLNCAAAQDYDSFYSGEIDFRQAFDYPPFRDLLVFELSGLEPSRVYSAAVHLRQQIMQVASASDIVYEPAPAAVFKVNNRHRYRIAMKTEETKALRGKISILIKRFMANKTHNGITLGAVFNPLE